MQIKVTSCERHDGISNYKQPYCLFNSLLKLALTETSNLRITSSWDSPYKGPVVWKTFPCHDDVSTLSISIMTSWHGNAVSISDPVTGGFPSQRVSNAEFCSLCYDIVKQAVAVSVISHAMTFRLYHCTVFSCYDDVIKWKHFPHY